MINNISILKNMSILYVEDEKDLREVTHEILKSFTKNQYIAENGQEGLELFTQLSHLKPSSFPVTSLNRSIMAVKFSFLLTTSSILAISSKIAKNACIAIAKV